MIKFHSLVFYDKVYSETNFSGLFFFLCRINLDNRVLQVSCVDLLKTKFTISLSELPVDYRFLLLDEYLSFQLEFSSVEFTEAFTTFSDSANSFLCRQKANDTDFNLLWRGQHTKSTNSLS